MDGLSIPAKRTEVLYSRVTSQNKKFIQRIAGRQEVSESALVDFILESFRKNYDSNKKKSRTRN